MTLSFQLDNQQSEILNRARNAFEPLHKRRDELRRIIVEKAAFPDMLWDALADSGFLGALIPQDYGGTGEGLLALAMAMEEMAALGYANGLPALTTMGAIGINFCGSEDLKKRFLPDIASGKLKLCYSATEKEAGFNIFSITTFAEQRGDHYVLNGRKVYTSGADVADYILVVARTLKAEQLKEMGVPKTFGLSMFLVDAKAEGIHKEPMAVRGEVGLHTYRMHYDNVKVPAENMVGDENQGVVALFQQVNPERVLFTSIMLGITRHCLAVACHHANERRVFRDTPIGQYQAVQHPLADVKLREESVRLLCHKAAWAFDQGQDAENVALYANAAKYLGAEMAEKAVDSAINAMGGRGFEEAHDIIHLWEGVRLMKFAPISSAMILNFVAERVLGLPRSY